MSIFLRARHVDGLSGGIRQAGIDNIFDVIIFKRKWILSLLNRLVSLVPQNSRFVGVVMGEDTSATGLSIQSDMISQSVVCHLAQKAGH